MPDDAQNPLVFISYARKDGLSAATHLDTALPGYGFRTWRDEREIDAAKDFTVEIEKAIRKANYVIACITPDIVKRDDSFVRREINYALFHKKPVIVARFANVPPPINVFNHTWIDYFGRDEAQADRELCQKLGVPPDDLPRTRPQDDPFRDYAGWLYDRMVRFLDQAVIRLIDLDVHTDPGKVAPPRRTETRDIFDQRYLPFEPQPAPQTDRDSAPPHFDTFTAAYEHYGGRLLLLGDPGAGKSVTLMAFARDAAAARLDDPDAPLPVFGVVATWDAENRTPLAVWLAEGHNVLNAQGLERVIDAGEALLLLDGLDELGGERQDRAGGERYDPRQRFLAQIPAQGRAVVSCRIEDYAQIKERAPLQGAITLQPLSDAQIRAYLSSDPDLLAAVESDDDLRAMVRTPLIMSLFAFAYRDQTDTGELRDLSASPRALRKMIFDRYVKSRYRWEQQRSPDPLPFTLDEIYEVLGYVAAENMLWAHQNLPAFGGFDDPDITNTGAVFEKRLGNVLPFADFVEALNHDSEQGAAFVSMVVRMHLVRVGDTDTYHFVHLLLLLHFVSLPCLINALQHGDASAREKAVMAIAKIGDTSVIPTLIGALSDSNPSVRYPTIVALRNAGDARAIPALITMLNDEIFWVRRSTAEALGKIGDASAVPALITALDDTDWLVRRNAAFALGHIGDTRAVPALITALGDANSNVHYSATIALGKIGDARAVPALVTALGDVKWEVRSNAAEALGQIGDAQAVPALIVALGDVVWDVRESAVGALVQIGTPSVPTLITNLGDVDWRVRGNAAGVLGRIGDEGAVPALISVLCDADWDVRESAAEALEKIGTPEALAAVAEYRRKYPRG